MGMRGVLTGVAGTLIALAAPAAASAGTVYVESPGAGTECTSVAPCPLQYGVETKANPGDVVILKDGVYSEGGDQLLIVNPITLRGEPGSRPRIEGTAAGGVVTVLAAALLQNIDVTGTGNAIFAYGGRLERVRATSTGSGTACFAVPQGANPLLISNSACISLGASGMGIHGNINTGAGVHYGAVVRNSTAFAPGASGRGIDYQCGDSIESDPTSECRVEVENSIIFGGDVDVRADGHVQTEVVINLRSSNYDELAEVDSATVTPVGTAGGQAALPLLVDPANGDITQLPTSPTIDAGDNALASGTLDFGGESRLSGPAVDIGADEVQAKHYCRGALATRTGTSGPDRITGTRGRDVIVAFAGNDRIRSLGGADLVCAGPGNDRLIGGAGPDRLYGESGNDRVAGGSGSDRLFGEAGRDLLLGGGGNDRLFGGAGRDRLKGLAGRRDRCNGGRGRDVRRAPGCERRRSIP